MSSLSISQNALLKFELSMGSYVIRAGLLAERLGHTFDSLSGCLNSCIEKRLNMESKRLVASMPSARCRPFFREKDYSVLAAAYLFRGEGATHGVVEDRGVPVFVGREGAPFRLSRQLVELGARRSAYIYFLRLQNIHRMAKESGIELEAVEAVPERIVYHDAQGEHNAYIPAEALPYGLVGLIASGAYFKQSVRHKLMNCQRVLEAVLGVLDLGYYTFDLKPQSVCFRSSGELVLTNLTWHPRGAEIAWRGDSFKERLDSHLSGLFTSDSILPGTLEGIIRGHQDLRHYLDEYQRYNVTHLLWVLLTGRPPYVLKEEEIRERVDSQGGEVLSFLFPQAEIVNFQLLKGVLGQMGKPEAELACLIAEFLQPSPEVGSVDLMKDLSRLLEALKVVHDGGYMADDDLSSS